MYARLQLSRVGIWGICPTFSFIFPSKFKNYVLSLTELGATEGLGNHPGSPAPLRAGKKGQPGIRGARSATPPGRNPSPSARVESKPQANRRDWMGNSEKEWLFLYCSCYSVMLLSYILINGVFVTDILAFFFFHILYKVGLFKFAPLSRGEIGF